MHEREVLSELARDQAAPPTSEAKQPEIVGVETRASHIQNESDKGVALLILTARVGTSPSLHLHHSRNNPRC